MAAYRHGMTTVVIPYGNASDISEIDEEVKKKVKFVPVKTIDEVFDVALKKEQKKQKKGSSVPAVIKNVLAITAIEKAKNITAGGLGA